MRSVVRRLPGVARRYYDDPLLRNSSLITLTTIMMAAAGGIFWVMAARLQSPQNVGLAGSMVATTETLAIFSLVGFDVALTRTLPLVRHGSSDVVFGSAVVFVVALVLASGYVLLLPVTSPSLARVLHQPWPLVVFALLTAGTAVNLLADAIFLALDRVIQNLFSNGVVIGALKCTLPFLLAGGGAVGLYGAFGLATTIGAGVCVALIVRYLGRPLVGRATTELRSSRGHARAAYVSAVLLLAPNLLLPLIIINELGPAANGHFFVAWQVFMLLSAVVASVGHSLFAEASRRPEQARHLVRRSALVLGTVSVSGAVVLVLATPLLLRIFGGSYAEDATGALRMLALAGIAMATNTHASTALRIAGHRAAMVLVQLVSSLATVGTAYALAPHGITWVAFAVVVGYLVGGVVGQLALRTVAPVVDRPLGHGVPRSGREEITRGQL